MCFKEVARLHAVQGSPLSVLLVFRTLLGTSPAWSQTSSAPLGTAALVPGTKDVQWNEGSAKDRKQTGSCEQLFHIVSPVNQRLFWGLKMAGLYTHFFV